MKFASFHLLGYLIVSLTAVVAFLVWGFIAKRRHYERFAQKALVKELISEAVMSRQKLKYLLLAVGFALSLCALLRPQWGFHWQEVTRKGVDIIIALDTSRSMLADDVKPSRFERSKLAIKDLVRTLQGDRIGLIAFAGTAFLQCPLTIDYSGFLLSLENIDTEAIPRGGTNISAAIDEAIRGYEATAKKHKALIIITDGEDHEGNAFEAAQKAKKEGIVIFCVGIGTREGELITITDEQGKKTYLKDSMGNVVKSRLNEELLEKIALATGGSYVRSSPKEFGLNLLYKEKISFMEKREFEGRTAKRYVERFYIPLTIAFLLFIIEPCIKT